MFSSLPGFLGMKGRAARPASDRGRPAPPETEGGGQAQRPFSRAYGSAVELTHTAVLGGPVSILRSRLGRDSRGNSFQRRSGSFRSASRTWAWWLKSQTTTMTSGTLRGSAGGMPRPRAHSRASSPGGGTGSPAEDAGDGTPVVDGVELVENGQAGAGDGARPHVENHRRSLLGGWDSHGRVFEKRGIRPYSGVIRMTSPR